MTQVTDRISNWVDEQTRLGDAVAAFRGRAFPSGRAGLFWPITVSSLIVCMLTGIVLLFFYDPSTAAAVYQGSYAPLHGVEMSGALQSTLALSYDVPGGMLLRQLHNWSSSLMIAALAVHILSVFFTGAFRRPRELMWLLLFGVLFLSMAAGLSGSVRPRSRCHLQRALESLIVGCEDGCSRAWAQSVRACWPGEPASSSSSSSSSSSARRRSSSAAAPPGPRSLRRPSNASSSAR